MNGRFVLRRSGIQFVFNLRAAGNHEVILTSERYTAKASAFKGIETIRENAPLDERHDRRVSSSGQAYFVLRAANNEVLGASELYSSPSPRDSGIAAVKANAPGALVDDETKAAPRRAEAQ
jgi:uncharacterized protein YegP (UPF0339 family)